MSQDDNNKRVAEDVKEEEEDLGPMPMLPNENPKKKRKVLPHEHLYLSSIPSNDRYYKSFMHRDNLEFVSVTSTNYLITTSIDGHLKLWHKENQGIEFRKHYRAHIAPIVGVSASSDGTLYATIAQDGSAKVFDIVNFDMINMFSFDFEPLNCCWIHKKGEAQSLLAVTQKDSPNIHLFDGRGDGKALTTLTSIHSKPVHILTVSSSIYLNYQIILILL